MNIKELRDADLSWADYVFISCMSTASHDLPYVLDRVKKAGRIAVLGGPHALAFYSSIPNVDCFVLGEAEGLWDAFLADLSADALKPAYAAPESSAEAQEMSDFFGTEAWILQADRRPDLSDAPTPRYDLVDLNDYALIPLFTTRGCPCQCDFCDIWRRFGQRSRHRRIEAVLADLDELYRLGLRGNVIFADDNFIGDKTYVRQLLTAIARWQIEHRRPFTFFGEGSLDLAEDPNMLELFAAAKVLSLFVGLETPHAESLKEARKYVNLKGDMAARVAVLQGYGIQVAAGFIVGFDSDPADIATQMSDAARDMGIPLVMTGLLLALPGTPLAERMEREGRLSPSLETISNSHTIIPNFSTLRPVMDVSRAYRDVLDRLYPDDMKSYFDRCRTFLGRRTNDRRSLKRIFAELAPGAQPKVPPPPKESKRRGAAILARILWKTARTPYRWNAFRFLAAIRRDRPEHFGAAVGDVAQAYHLWFMTRTYLEAAKAWDFFREQAEYFLARHDHDLPQSRATFALAPPSPPGGSGAVAPNDLVEKALNAIEDRMSALTEPQRMIIQDYHRILRDELLGAFEPG